MKLVYAFILIGALLIGTSSAIILRDTSPEELVTGKWEEVSWAYEKCDISEGGYTEISDVQKEEIYKNLVIHKAEIWEFSPGGKLSLFMNQEKHEELHWSIKGRGHILELSHPDLRVEDYQILEITRDQMVVHFNIDLQMRGVVKMTFKRIE